ncbi:MAG: hypothetical protein QOH57_3448 [Mycobacterium sp.]|nr:hypothetical protein [Mycobacterium sp.]
MKVHHLNCGTMRAPTAPLVCHVLLVETDNGLVLIDSGFGLDDCADPARRVGPTRHLIRPIFAQTEAAVRQIEQLGFSTDDVRHIVITHFDVDHIGGLSDFPRATVHVTAVEALAAMKSPTWQEKIRYRRRQWAHGPTVVEHDADGEQWRGFTAKELDGIAPGIVLVPLPGHTRGHACVAVDAGHRWVLHCGDAFYHYGTLDGQTPIPRALRVSEALIAFDRKQVQHNHARLHELHDRRDPELLIVNAHDPHLLEYAQHTASP